MHVSNQHNTAEQSSDRPTLARACWNELPANQKRKTTHQQTGGDRSRHPKVYDPPNGVKVSVANENNNANRPKSVGARLLANTALNPKIEMNARIRETSTQAALDENLARMDDLFDIQTSD